MMPSGVKLTGVHAWPRRVRVTLYVVVLVLSLLLMAALVAVGQFMLVNSCGTPVSQSPIFCSGNGQALVLILALALVSAVYFPWLRFLVRILAITEKAPVAGRAEMESRGKAVRWPPELMQLPLGQNLITGRVTLDDAGRHRITVGGLPLRFWGGYALRQGLLRSGERAAFVYQRDPLFGTHFVLAFWKGPNTPIRGVGGVMHACFLVLAIVGTVIIPVLRENYPVWLMPVCGALFAVSCVYLLLLIFAKRALRATASD